MNIQQLRAQIAALQYATMDENRHFRSTYDEGKFEALTAVNALLDSLQEESVSEELEEASRHYALNNTPWDDCADEMQESFKAGAKWQKKQMMSKAIDGKVLINGMGNPILHLWDKGRHLIDKKVKVILIKED